MHTQDVARGDPATRVSVVIPALNEAAHIGQCIDRIREAMAAWTPEIIVVDNGSSDQTPDIALHRGVVVLSSTGTISTLRNIGVAHSSGDVVAFIDADVMLRPGYGDGFRQALEVLDREPRAVVGAVYDLPDCPSWVQRVWSDPRGRSLNHVPAGNMIVTRRFFKELGGFDVGLPTGEDHDLCARAWPAGGRVIQLPALHTGHEGYPRTVRAFIRREAWCGTGDWVSLAAVRSSRVAHATFVFVALHLILVVGIIRPAFAVIGIIGIISLLALMVATKNRHAPIRRKLSLAALWYCYYLGRSFALGRAVLRLLREIGSRNSRS